MKKLIVTVASASCILLLVVFIANITSRQLGTCPFGHDELKEVPVTYGLLYWTPALHRKAENLEFLAGGEPLENDARACGQCRVEYL